MKRMNILLIPVSICLGACAATPLQAPQAADILVSRNAPAPQCRFVGEVRGSQGNFATANFTRDENLLIGARNQMRDAAYQLGANYVQVELESHSENTTEDSLGGVYNSTVIGNAYACPEPQTANVAGKN